MGLITFSVCTLSACAKPQYIIPGLTLPPGAVIMKHRDIAPNRLIGNKIRVVDLWFNCPAGWEAVETHVDRCMRKAGYRDVTGAVIKLIQDSRKAKELEDPDESSKWPIDRIDSGSPEEAQEAEDTAMYWHFYKKEGSQYQVVLRFAIGYDTSPTAKVMYEGRDVTKYDYADFVIKINENSLGDL